jgi:hypothetical protein
VRLVGLTWHLMSTSKWVMPCALAWLFISHTTLTGVTRNEQNLEISFGQVYFSIFFKKSQNKKIPLGAKLNFFCWNLAKLDFQGSGHGRDQVLFGGAKLAVDGTNKAIMVYKIGLELFHWNWQIGQFLVSNSNFMKGNRLTGRFVQLVGWSNS